MTNPIGSSWQKPYWIKVYKLYVLCIRESKYFFAVWNFQMPLDFRKTLVEKSKWNSEKKSKFRTKDQKYNIATSGVIRQ